MRSVRFAALLCGLLGCLAAAPLLGAQATPGSPDPELSRYVWDLASSYPAIPPSA